MAGKYTALMNWLSKLLKSMGHEPAVARWDSLLADASSRNGYVRERAVIAIARTGRDDGLAVLLTRANDWVAEVRQAAQAGIGLYLTSTHLSAWGRSLEQVSALQRAGRADHSGLLRQIRGYLSTSSNLQALRLQNPSPTIEVARLLFSLELDIPGSDADRFGQLNDAVRGTDILTASMAISSILRLAKEMQIELAVVACGSPFAPIRARGLRAAVGLGGPMLRQLIFKMCSDKSPGVRGVALKEIGPDQALLEIHLREVYGSAPSTASRAIALDALCALGVADAGTLCLNAVSDASSLVRGVAAAHRFKVAGPVERDQLVVEILRDPSARVRRIALLWVQKGCQAPDVPMLLQLAQGRPAVFQSLARVAIHLSPWARLEFLLALATLNQKDPILTRALHKEIELWCADMPRCFVTPSDQQSGVIRRYWAGLRDELIVDLQQKMGFQLRQFGVLARP